MSERRRRRATDEAADQPSVRRRRYNTRSAAREDADAETRRRWSEESSARASQASRDTQPRSGSSRRANRSNQRGGGTRRHTQLDQRVNTTSRNRSNAANQRPPRIQLTSRMSTGGRMYAPQLLASLNAQRRSRMARSRELIGRFIRALRATSPVRHRLPSNARTRPRRQERPESRNVFNPVVAIEDIFGGSTSARSVSTRSSDAFAAALRPLIAQSGSGSRLNIRLAFREGDSDSNNSSSDVDFHLGNILNTAEGGDSSADDVFYSDLERLDSDSADSLTSATAVEPPRSYVSISLDGLHSSPTLSISSTEPARSFVSLSPDGLSSSPTPSLSEAETVIHHDTDSEAGDDNDAFRIIHIPVFADSAGSPVIFTRNNVSIDLMRRMSELSDAVFNLRNRLQTHTDGGFSPPRNFSLEPTRRRVPESVDCQRSKLTDELNSGTCECVICTDVICSTDQVWPCNNCFNIFHLPCIRRWAKTNRSTEMHGAWICPVCRRPKYCTPNKLRYRCLCGRILKPKSVPGVTPHCCGKQCKHHCGLLCHPGPCRMSPAECEAVAQEPSTSQTAAEPTRSASV